MKRKKTGLQIEGDIFQMLKTTALMVGTWQIAKIDGALYRGGTRPRDSRAEDCVVIFTTANAEQFPEGVVTVNVFVPDISSNRNGVMSPNGLRCEQIEYLAQTSFEELCAEQSDYRFTLRETIHTIRDLDIHQSIVVMSLRFKYYTL